MKTKNVLLVTGGFALGVGATVGVAAYGVIKFFKNERVKEILIEAGADDLITDFKDIAANSIIVMLYGSRIKNRRRKSATSDYRMWSGTNYKPYTGHKDEMDDFRKWKYSDFEEIR